MEHVQTVSQAILPSSTTRNTTFPLTNVRPRSFIIATHIWNFLPHLIIHLQIPHTIQLWRVNYRMLWGFRPVEPSKSMIGKCLMTIRIPSTNLALLPGIGTCRSGECTRRNRTRRIPTSIDTGPKKTYEEIKYMAKARLLSPIHQRQEYMASINQNLVEEEVRSVQSGHRRVLGELNLAV